MNEWEYKLELYKFKSRMRYGYCVLGVLGILAGLIAIGKVQQATSYGLDYILGGLGGISAAFAGWAFSQVFQSKPPSSSGDVPSSKELS